jgi:ATP-dependent DNA helicase RecG
LNIAELAELIGHGENSGVEFKRDDVRPESLAKEIAALLNLEGGYILLGVEDDGSVSGLARDPAKAEEWVMQVIRDVVRPAAIPYWETIEWEVGRVVGVVHLLADSPDKPYKAKRGAAWITQIRVGTTSRDATDEDEARLYAQSGRLPYDLKPVVGATLEDLDHRRLADYFRSKRAQDPPPDEDEGAWRTLLLNTDLMVEDRGRAVPTVAAVILFGRDSPRLIPQSGITAVAYQTTEKDYAATERAVLRGPTVGLFTGTNALLEEGVIEKALAFVRRNTAVASTTTEGRREDRSDYPDDVIREVVVNAVAHRDYTIVVTDIELSIYPNRLEVISPGRLPNTVTVDKMRAGYRATRNELLKDVLRDYRYIEATGLGVPRKIILGMLEHNGSDVDLIEEDDRFLVRLRK